MINQPETQKPNPQQGKLVLPDHPHEMSPINPDQANHLASGKNQQNTNAHLRPDQLIRQTTPPPARQPVAKLRYYWQKDPAYKVLMIAIAMIMVAGLVFVSLISNVLLRNPNFLAINSTAPSLPTVVPTGTVDPHPAFPLPSGGNGSTSSSQPPAHSTPILQPTANATPTASPPTPTPGEGSLTVTITAIPVRVSNNSTVNVGVNTSLPNVSVSLVAYYTVLPFKYTSSSTTTNGNGNASLSWSVSLLMYGHHTQAMVYAVVRDQNGQKVQSQAIAVQVNNNGG
ncbi:MAG: hypothetical protein M3Y76_08095 [Chloroflexota bacterium]|nr:hypothetical protein [Chloroflexota bacterium]